MLYRIRHVKCDERKPSCLRCDKFGVSCDGYEVYISPAALRERRPTSLLPRKAASLSIFTPSSTVKFESQEEYQYFLHYRSETSLDISGAMPEDVWSQVIPQASESTQALRDLTLAVAAIDKAMHSSSLASHFKYAVCTIFSFPIQPICITDPSVPHPIPRNHPKHTVW
jgi:hypothetical protein